MAYIGWKQFIAQHLGTVRFQMPSCGLFFGLKGAYVFDLKQRTDANPGRLCYTTGARWEVSRTWEQWEQIGQADARADVITKRHHGGD
ncbi:MAG: hypothetical protein AAF386_06455 [Pseudomonadota bacterium]